jgi:hypothetical protein
MRGALRLVLLFALYQFALGNSEHLAQSIPERPHLLGGGRSGIWDKLHTLLQQCEHCFSYRVQVACQAGKISLTECRQRISLHVTRILAFILQFAVVNIQGAQLRVPVDMTVAHLMGGWVIPFRSQESHHVVRRGVEGSGYCPIPEWITEAGDKIFIVSGLGQMFVFRRHRRESPLYLFNAISPASVTISPSGRFSRARIWKSNSAKGSSSMIACSLL